MKENLVPEDMVVLSFLEKKPSGASKPTIERKLKKEGIDAQLILPKLRQLQFVRAKYRQNRQAKKGSKKTLVYFMNPLLREYIKDYLSTLSAIPFMEARAIHRIQEVRTSQKTPRIKLRMAEKALEYLKKKNRIILLRISSKETIPRIKRPCLIAKVTKMPREIDNRLKIETISALNLAEAPQVYIVRKRRKLAGYFVRTEWKRETYYSLIDPNFVWFLRKVKMSFFGKETAKLNQLQDTVSQVCGVKYPAELILTACYLAAKAKKSLGMDILFKIPIKEPIQKASIPMTTRRFVSAFVEPDDSYLRLIRAEEAERIKKERATHRDSW